MRIGDTKYYRIEQLMKNNHVIGNLILIGRQYGYIVQLHYFDKPGYKVNECFDSIKKAENYFENVLRTEGENNVI